MPNPPEDSSDNDPNENPWKSEDDKEYPRTATDDGFGHLPKFGDELENEENVAGRAHHQPDHDSPVVHEPAGQELSSGDDKKFEDVPETNVSLEFFKNLFKRKS